MCVNGKNHQRVHRHLLTNHLHNNVLAKFYCDVITGSYLQLINTSISTFFNKRCIFLTEQQRRRRPKMDKKKLRRWSSR